MFESRVAPETSGIVYYLPRSLATITTERRAKTDTAGPEVVFTLAEDSVADTSQRYVLNYQGNPFFKDRLCVVVGTNGYLSSIEYASEDTTPRIAVALAELAAKATSFPTPAPSGPSLDSADEPPAVPAFPLTFDPLVPEQLETVSEQISAKLNAWTNDDKKKKTYTIKFPDADALIRTSRNAKRGRGQTCDGKGVCFRTKIRTIAHVLEDGKVRVLPVDMVGPVAGNIDLDRLFLVEKVTRLKFENGALTEFIMRRPSQALQAAKLPLDILDVLLAVPTNFLGNLTGTADAQTAYVNSLKSRTDALAAINTNLGTIAQRTAPEDGVEAASSALFQLKCNGQLIKPVT